MMSITNYTYSNILRQMQPNYQSHSRNDCQFSKWSQLIFVFTTFLFFFKLKAKYDVYLYDFNISKFNMEIKFKQDIHIIYIKNVLVLKFQNDHINFLLGNNFHSHKSQSFLLKVTSVQSATTYTRILHYIIIPLFSQAYNICIHDILCRLCNFNHPLTHGAKATIVQWLTVTQACT